MSKFDGVLEQCLKQMEQINVKADKKLLTAIAKSLGPSLYKKDALLVAAAQKSELETIKKNFLIKKLGCTEKQDLDGALQHAIDQIGRSNRRKLRPVFYYLLVKKLKKSKVYA